MVYMDAARQGPVGRMGEGAGRNIDCEGERVKKCPFCHKPVDDPGPLWSEICWICKVRWTRDSVSSTLYTGVMRRYDITPSAWIVIPKGALLVKEAT